MSCDLSICLAMGGLIIDHPRFLPADHLSAFALCYYPLSSSKWNYFLPDEILLGNSGAGSATQITRLLKLCNLEQIHRMGWLGRDLKARPVPPPAMSREPCTAPCTSGKLSWLLPDLHPFFFQPDSIRSSPRGLVCSLEGFRCF